MENKCIYCGKTEDLSESDVIPDALTNARILNRNVCRIEHNNKFSDMFESKVIDAFAFITNKLDIKSSKGKKYASYDAVVNIRGKDYVISMHRDNEIFNGRVLKSSDKTQVISSYDKAVKIAGNKSKVQLIDVNHIEIEKKVRINNEIFFDKAMYRMLAKIAFEWYCTKNDVIGYYEEFKDIIGFITTGEGENPVSIIQEQELYKMLDNQINLGSHALFAFEKQSGEINVVIYLFGILMYRVVVTKSRPVDCNKNFLFTELRTDSSRNEIEHQSLDEATKYFWDNLNPEKFQRAVVINGITFMMPKKITVVKNMNLYTEIFSLVKCFIEIDNDAMEPNDRLNKIFLNQLKNITQASTLQKKSIKRFVNDNFYDGHQEIKLNPYTSNKKAIVLFYAIYLIGRSEELTLDDRILQKILKEGFSCTSGQEIVINDDRESKLKEIMLKDNNYTKVLERGAEKVKAWQN